MILCAQRFSHEVPNSDLYLMKKVKDVVEFYCTPVEGTAPYERLVKIQKKDQLPANLHLLPDAVRYDPDSNFLKGLDAFPGTKEMPLRTLREKKVLPRLKTQIRWPDV